MVGINHSLKINNDIPLDCQISTLDTSLSTPNSLEANILQIDAELKKFDKVDSLQKGVAYPNSILFSSSKTLFDKLDKHLLDINVVGMAKESNISIVSSPISIPMTNQSNEDDMPLNSRSWIQLAKKKKSMIVSMHDKSYGKRAMSDSEENQLDLPSKHLQVLKDDEAEPLKLAEAVMQPRQEQ